ncbi:MULTISPECIES: sialate O-acetylesterase [Flavobacteriaceae]|uniref:sialate O-acetylesterase n=1 Tax=Flavobacteriaceae TaxID=49546 RepID=UPI0023492714|nr:sialate O-acetylesterase [Muricauda sp. SP22]MDC6362632.1 sialate O-acetylesterase [Muricauda sp. SP22]
MKKRRIKYRWPFLMLILVVTLSCKSEQDEPEDTDAKETELGNPNIWVFLMAGQSNMAGRGIIEQEDQVANKRIITINSKNQWVAAKEPLHFYEPDAAGLDCGMSFAQELLTKVPDSVTIALVPCAVGGSSVFQWQNDEDHRGVSLLSNLNQKVALAKKKGVIKGILWHQGESNANAEDLPRYSDALLSLFIKFRTMVQNEDIPIVMGELGRFAEPEEKAAYFNDVNTTLGTIAEEDNRLFLVSSEGLDHKGDHLHFNSAAQRKLGKKYAQIMIQQLIME